MSVGEDGTFSADKVAAEYAGLVGEIKGYAETERELLDIVERQERAEQEEE